ncbi:MAG: PBP1A family penicillin-binding protein [Nitrospirota bacterium]|nr:PBP1A family penicillin-binding protein [Nitrospirota bacterium]MDH5699089.1 PBP1A family penicillin-binding protein [Nitrospirota bacterium]
MSKIQTFFSRLRGWSWLRIAMVTTFLALCIGVGSIAGILWIATRDLPTFDSFQDYHPSLVSRVYADNGEIIGQFFIERRLYTPIDKIPQAFTQAVIATEDTRFFDHPGLDIVGIGRAAWTNLKKGGRFQGASTITQQLARALFLSPERTYQRKIKELILAVKMEWVLTKEQILEMYLNQIYFGHGAYGVAAAALTYFDKNVSDLNLPEAAFLAGLPKAPNTYSPYRNPDLAKSRKELVLGRMVEAGYITEEDAQAAMATTLSYRHQSIEPIAAYFLEEVRQHLVDRYGETLVYKGGLQIYTTLNIAMQKSAEEAVRTGLRQLDKRQGWRGPIGHVDFTKDFTPPDTFPELQNPKFAFVHGLYRALVTKVTKQSAQILIGNTYKGSIIFEDMRWAQRRLEKTGDVGTAVVRDKAFPPQLLKVGDIIEVAPKKGTVESGEFVLEQTPLVEGSLIAMDPRTGAVQAMVGGYDFTRSQFNRAVIARRQPGSAFKPLIYASALQQGLTPATLILDAPVVYEDEDLDRVWKPENYEKRFFGTITLREALRHSRNAATVRLLEQIGVPEVVNIASNLGIRSPLSQDLSLALGSSSVTLQEITSAYGVFADQGLWLEPYLITHAKNPNGEILEQHLFEPRQAMTKENAYLITNMLMDVIQSGTGRLAKSIGRPLAGKTGTTNSYNDAWFVGYAPNLTTGVWVGFDGVRTLGRLESGAHAALPIWTWFMDQALRNSPVMTFPIPSDIQFAQIDTTTGDLPSKTSQHIGTEVFRKGTEPGKAAPQKANPMDFFEFDRMNSESANQLPLF